MRKFVLSVKKVVSFIIIQKFHLYFTTFHPYCLRFSCYTFGQENQRAADCPQTKGKALQNGQIKDPPADDTGGKSRLLPGSDFWHTQPVERLGVPAVMMSDGPSGLRKQDEQGDHLGINESIPAVCFPSSAAVASSFDTALAEKLGETLGNECRAENLALLLGPGLNIKRSCADVTLSISAKTPILSGEMGAALVNGIQSNGGAAASSILPPTIRRPTGWSATA